MYKHCSFLKNIFQANSGQRLRQPYKMIYIVTYKCNLRCTMCNIWKSELGNGHKKELSVPEIEHIFNGLPGLAWLDFSGGEIGLREDVLDIVDVILGAAKKLLVMHISTNGQFPDIIEKIAKKIRSYNVIPVINVSVDAPRDIHDTLRGKTGAYESAIETYQRLKKIKRIHSFLSCTISRFTLPHVDSLLDSLQKDIASFSMSDIHFNLFHASPHYYQNHTIEGLSGVPADQITKYMTVGRTGSFIKKLCEGKYVRGLDYFLHGKQVPVRCQALNSSFFLNPYGELYSCSIDGPSLGNVRDFDLSIPDWWHTEQVQRQRTHILEGRCAQCWTPCEAYNALLGDVKGAFAL